MYKFVLAFFAVLIRFPIVCPPETLQPLTCHAVVSSSDVQEFTDAFWAALEVKLKLHLKYLSCLL
jgi:hypothetical protein